MKPPISKLHFFLSLLLPISWLPPSLAGIYQRYIDCAPTLYRCGDLSINVSYPFRVDGRHDYCGYLDYYLICTSNQTLTIMIANEVYKVKGIDYSNHRLSLVDMSFASDPCPVPKTNMTVDLFRYEYSERDVNFTFYSNCTPLVSNSLFHPVECIHGTVGRQSYFTDSNSGSWDDRPTNCSLTTFVAVDQAAANKLESNSSSLSDTLLEGFSLKWMAGKGWCSNCTLSGGRCGYNIASPADHTCICADGLVLGTCSSGKNSSKRNIIIGVVAGVAALLAVCCAIFLYRHKKRHQRSSSLLLRAPYSESFSKKDPELGSAYYQTQTFSYKELEEATDCFSVSNELGDGGFGTVYKGKLRDGRTVAVKRLYENNYKRVEQFMNEIAILSRLRHHNLVTLYGCSSRHSRELLLVYEFVPKGTVADHLHGPHAAEGALTWPVRMSIAIETADALAYLHAIEPQIIHRDVKTNNILLDSNFHVKVADFGLSRLFPVDATHVSTAPQGTPGYVDPEYHQCYQLTDKSDVYSFGVVLVELISSMPAVDISRHRHEINLSNMAINRIQNRELDQLIDPGLGYESDCQVRCMITQVAELAFRCLQGDRDMRPPIKEVLEVLQAIESGDHRAEVATKTDANTKTDTPLLRDATMPYSPNTVTDKWGSRSTTPNSSGSGS